MTNQYKRILLKVSGEALAGEKGAGFDEVAMRAICEGIREAHTLGTQIGVVVGGGNFWRGRSSGEMERTCADKIGMLATIMNALAAVSYTHLDVYKRQGLHRDPHRKRV